MLIKALFFDLDRTLLTSEKRISPATMEALAACRAKGIGLYPATARPPLLPKMLGWDQRVMDLFDGGVYYNGGCVLAAGEKRYRLIDPVVVREAVGCVRAFEDINLCLQLTDEAHAFCHPLEAHAYAAWGIEPRDALPLCAGQETRTVKMLAYYANLIDACRPLPGAFVRAMEELCAGKAQLYLTDEGQGLQVMGSGVTKHAGVRAICDFLGIGPDQYAAFGDDTNDVEMLSNCPNGVAMGNAPQDVKASARYITLGNDQDGIVHAITNILGIAI